MPIAIPFTTEQLTKLIDHLEGDDAPVMSAEVADMVSTFKQALALTKMPVKALASNKGDVALRKAVVLLQSSNPKLSAQLAAYIEVEEASSC